ncbi:MAG: GNAT family N-acetyltransferase [Rhizonema sp. PD37]|nr:GNAT family N-acetyltransferase [Rhizonema sp. PD37]
MELTEIDKEGETVYIRPAMIGDIEALLAIYNDAVLHTTATYDYNPRSLPEQLTWFQSKQEGGYPILVGIIKNNVVGFSSYGSFRARPGYCYTVEHSVYVHQNFRCRGLARILMTSLLQHAKNAGYHMMIGGIDADNIPSLNLHEQLGFIQVGHLKEVGWKFERRLDLIMVQKIL